MIVYLRQLSFRLDVYRLCQASHVRLHNYGVCHLSSHSASNSLGNKITSHLRPLNRRWISSSVDASVVSAYSIASRIDLARLSGKLDSIKAEYLLRDGLLLVTKFGNLGNSTDRALLTADGGLVLWTSHKEDILAAFRHLVGESANGESLYDQELTSQHSEALPIKGTGNLCEIAHGQLTLTAQPSDTTLLTISLALLTAVKLNFLENEINLNLLKRNASIKRLRKNLKLINLDKLSKTLFEYQIFAHECRYRLNHKQSEKVDLIVPIRPSRVPGYSLGV